MKIGCTGVGNFEKIGRDLEKVIFQFFCYFQLIFWKV